MNEIEVLLKKLTEGEITSEEKAFLSDWIRENPEQWNLSLYDAYRLTIESGQQYLTEHKSKHLLDRIYQEIEQRHSVDRDPLEKNEPAFADGNHRRMNPVRWYLGIAASFLVACSLAYFLETTESPRHFTSGQASSSVSSIRPVPKTETIENNSTAKIPVALPDGSTVFLYPASKLSYSDPFDGKREVRLWGKAFFEIVKQPENPFFVYANEMVTEVLGTSFVINAFDDKDLFSISVKTGKVSVKAASESLLSTGEIAETKVSLIANEKVVFDRGSRKFVAENTLPIPPAEDVTPEFPEIYRFKDTPIVEILSVLRRDYAIEIQVDEEKLANCSLTTTLKDKPLYEKLKIICEGIGPSTHFSMSNGQITINTLGCNY